jgi:hypothetical protein
MVMHLFSLFNLLEFKMGMQFNVPSSNQNNDSWKAQAFLNLWVKRADGSRAKVGAIPLREAKAFEKALIARLQQDGAMDAFVGALEIDFQLADKPTKDVNVGF